MIDSVPCWSEMRKGKTPFTLHFLSFLKRKGTETEICDSRFIFYSLSYRWWFPDQGEHILEQGSVVLIVRSLLNPFIQLLTFRNAFLHTRPGNSADRCSRLSLRCDTAIHTTPGGRLTCTTVLPTQHI